MQIWSADLWKTIYDEFCITAGANNITQRFNTGTLSWYNLPLHGQGAVLWIFKKRRGQLSLSEQPAFRSGITTFFRGSVFWLFLPWSVRRQNNHIGIRFCLLLRQSKTIPDIVSHILYIRLLVVMCQQYGILFLLQPLDSRKQIKWRINVDIEKAILSTLFSASAVFIFFKSAAIFWQPHRIFKTKFFSLLNTIIFNIFLIKSLLLLQLWIRGKLLL